MITNPPEWDYEHPYDRYLDEIADRSAVEIRLTGPDYNRAGVSRITKNMRRKGEQRGWKLTRQLMALDPSDYGVVAYRRHAVQAVRRDPSLILVVQFYVGKTL